MAMPVLTTERCNGDHVLATSAATAATVPQRRIPSFKLVDDERARSKRLRNRSSASFGTESAGERPAVTPMLDDALDLDERDGPRLSSSFVLGSEALRGVAHTREWDAGAECSNAFTFGSESADGDSDDAQPLDDTALSELNFMTMMDDAGTAEMLPGQSGVATPFSARQGDSSAPGGCTGDRLFGKSFHGSADYTYGTSPDACVLSTTAGVGKANGTRDAGGDDSMFDPGNQLPTFSVPMEAFLNQQLEAAEQSLKGRDDAGLTCNHHSVPSGTGSGSYSHVQDDSARSHCHQSAASDSTQALAHNSPRFVAMKPERDDYAGPPDIVYAGGLFAASTTAGARDINVSARAIAPDEGSLQPDTDEREEVASVHARESFSPQKEKPQAQNRRKGRGCAAVRAAKTSRTFVRMRGGAPASAVPTGGTLKRQTSEDVAARLPLKVLECFYHVPLNVAAQELNVSLTMLKKLCRAYGVKRWPHRQVSSLDKTITRLQDRIRMRKDGGKDAPSLVRKLTQAKKRRSVIIKTASAGLETDVLNAIFTCRPGEIDEDLLLSSSDVAKVLEEARPWCRDGSRDSDSNDDDEDDDAESRTSSKSSFSAASTKSCVRSAAVAVTTPSKWCTSPTDTAATSHPPAFEPGGSTQNFPVEASAELTAAKEEHVSPASSAATTTAKRRGKRVSATGTKGRRLPFASAAASRRAATFKARIASGVTKETTVTVTGAAIPSQDISSPCRGSVNNSTMSTARDTLSGNSSPTFSFGDSPRGRTPTTNFSSAFGVSAPSNSSLDDISSPMPPTPASPFGMASTVRSGGPDSAVSPVRRAEGETAGHVSEWSTMASIPCASFPQHLSDGGAGSPTVDAAADNFSAKLCIDSPPGTMLLPSPIHPPPPPLHHAYLVQQSFPPRSGLHPLNWAPSHYPPAHHPCGLPLDAMSPIDTGFPMGLRGCGIYAFPAKEDSGKVQPVESAGTCRPPELGGWRAGHEEGLEGASSPSDKAAAVANRLLAMNERNDGAGTGTARARRTGVMSFLLNSAPSTGRSLTSDL